MAPPSDRVVVAHIASRRVILIALVLSAFLVLELYTAFSRGFITTSGAITRDTWRFSAIAVCVAGGVMMTMPYVICAIFGGGFGIYAENRRLVFPWPIFKPAHLDRIVSISTGPEGIFYGEPVSVTFNLAGGRALTIYTVWFRTPVSEMIASLRAAGLSAPVRDGLSKSG